MEQSKINYLFLGLITFYLLASFGLGFFLRNQNLSTNLLLVISQLLVFLPVCFYLMITKTSVKKLIRFQKLKVSTILLVILFAVLIIPLITFINTVSMLFSENSVSDLSYEMIGNGFWMNLLLMAIFPAMNEEFVFRGVFYHTYRKKSVLWAMVLSGVLFGLLHLNINQFSYAFVLGIVFALLVEATGSVFASMIAHFIINANSVVLMTFYSAWIQYLNSHPEMKQSLEEVYGYSFDIESMYSTSTSTASLLPALLFYGGVAAATTTLAIGVYIWICKRNHTLPHIKGLLKKSEEKPRDTVNFSVLSVVALVIGIIICLGYMVITEYLL